VAAQGRFRGGAAALCTALVLAASALCACDRDGAASGAAAPVLNLYSWAEYFPDAVLAQFTAETGVRVNYAVFDSNDVAETTLSAGHSGFDLVTVNAAPHLGRQIPRGLWQPLDKARLQNLGNVDATILQMLARVDPGNRYAIPYMWGTTGIIYNADMIRSIAPDAPVDSLDMLLRPGLVEKFRDCGVSVLGTWVDMMPILLQYLGRPDLPVDAASLALASRTFAAVRPALRRVTTSGYYDQLARGELCLAIGYSADAMVARRIAAQIGSGVRIEFRHPREVVPMYIDAFAIPADAPHPEAALRFIDFVLRPEIGAQLANATGFSIANTAAIARLEPALRDNPIAYPPPEVRARFAMERAFTMDETRTLSRTWLHARAGY
jgi:putrescine transport system substrate-binding protein